MRILTKVAEMFPSTKLNPSSNPFDFVEGDVIGLPTNFKYKDALVDTRSFLQETDTSAVLVIQKGAVRYEEYLLNGGRNVNWLSMSVAKSFISAMIGIAVEEGKINNIEEPVTQYVPSLKGSAYDGVRIKDLLQMSSGARWNEDYGDPESDINRMGKIMALGGSLNEFAATLTTDKPPGTYNLYNSTDTQVLGMLLQAATGQSVTAYMQAKLWEPLGMESPAYWMIDDEGMEMVFGGLNATARDYAKLGELYRLQGQWQGSQLVPAQWVTDSITPDAPHLLPGENPMSDFDMGYGYQWWIMDGDRGDYSAIGVYNQFIYVDPSKGLVVVKLSANSDYAATNEESSFREFETIEFMRAIGDLF
jgi:CubicO group peptidase (beta-lactamase class C family)